MNKWQHNQADALNLHNDVLVLMHTLHIPFQTFIEAAGDSDMFILLEILLAEYFAPSRVIGREQAEQLNSAWRDGLYSIVVRVSINPERNRILLISTCIGFKCQRIRPRCADKKHMRNNRADNRFLAGYILVFFGKVDLFT